MASDPKIKNKDNLDETLKTEDSGDKSKEETTVITVKSGKSLGSSQKDIPSTRDINIESETEESAEPVIKKSDAPMESKSIPIGDEPKKVSSFSLLDADKKPSDVAQDSPAEAEKEIKTEEVKKDKDEVSQEEIKDWMDIASDKAQDGEKGGGFKKILLFLIIAAIVGVIAGGVYYYTTNVQKGTSSSETPDEQTSQDSQQPTPTEVEELPDLTQLKVQILNGSGIPGEAGKVEDLLVEAGFEDIATGNAESYDYKDTEVSLKSDIPGGVFDEIDKALSEVYTPALSEENLDETSEFDIVIIVGVKK